MHEHHVAIEGILVRRAPDQRQKQKAIDHPIAGKGSRDADEQAEQRVDVVEGEREEGSECPGGEELSVGEVQHAGDAVLQIEAERDQAVHPAEDEAVQHYFEHVIRAAPAK